MDKSLPKAMGISVVVIFAGVVIGIVLFCINDEEFLTFDFKTEERVMAEELLDEREKIKEVESILVDFLGYLYKKRDYDRAVDLYFYETERKDARESLEWSVDSYGFGRPGFPEVEEIRVLEKEKVAEESFEFVIQFLMTNGDKLKHGPCCGYIPEEGVDYGWDRYLFTLEKIEGDYKVTGGVTYIP